MDLILLMILNDFVVGEVLKDVVVFVVDGDEIYFFGFWVLVNFFNNFV